MKCLDSWHIVDHAPKYYVAGLIADGGRLPLDQVIANCDRFDAVETRLLELGYRVVNPVSFGDPRIDPAVQITVARHYQCMRRDLRALLDCDGICLIDNWERSKGARLEYAVAVGTGMSIAHERELR